jgi:dTDP-4-amino-4,6-dideoxygalactose transaminase
LIIPVFKSIVSFSDIRTLLRCLVMRDRTQSYGETFLKDFAAMMGLQSALWVPSMRWGLYQALLACDFEPGSEIILSAFNYHAVPAAIEKTGMVPTFVDVKVGSMLIDPQEVEKNITPKTCALMVTHLSGMVCDMDALCALAKKHNLMLIEDCAQACGASYGGKSVGSFGDISVFSFGITKNFTTLGGGVIACKDSNLLFKIKERVHELKPLHTMDIVRRIFKACVIVLATSRWFFPVVYGVMVIFDLFNVDIIQMVFSEKATSDMPDRQHGAMHPAQGLLGCRQLRSLEERNKRVSNIGHKLYDALRLISGVHVPTMVYDAFNVFISCPVFVANRKSFKRALLRQGIHSEYGFVSNCARLSALIDKQKEYPHAERAERDIVYVPIWSSMSDTEIACIASACAKGVSDA